MTSSSIGFSIFWWNTQRYLKNNLVHRPSLQLVHNGLKKSKYFQFLGFTMQTFFYSDWLFEKKYPFCKYSCKMKKVYYHIRWSKSSWQWQHGERKNKNVFGRNMFVGIEFKWILPEIWFEKEITSIIFYQ